jgi:hypothetical protein
MGTSKQVLTPTAADEDGLRVEAEAPICLIACSGSSSGTLTDTPAQAERIVETACATSNLSFDSAEGVMAGQEAEASRVEALTGGRSLPHHLSECCTTLLCDEGEDKERSLPAVCLLESVGQGRDEESVLVHAWMLLSVVLVSLVSVLCRSVLLWDQ